MLIDMFVPALLTGLEELSKTSILKAARTEFISRDLY